MRRKSPVRSRQTRPDSSRPCGLRLEGLEDRTVPTTLTLSLADPTRVEGQATTATITRTGDLSQELTVSLDSSDPSEVTIPASVVIPTGEASANFPVGMRKLSRTWPSATWQTAHLVPPRSKPIIWVGPSGIGSESMV